MSEHFNGLTPPEAERLAMLAEEAAEVIQIVGKILRHGYASKHPDDLEGPDNRAMLHRELLDFEAVRALLDNAGDVPFIPEFRVGWRAHEKARRYAHHQLDSKTLHDPAKRGGAS